MEHIILGLLLLQPRTIYQLRKRIFEGLNLMYSCSTGSIQAALKKLLKLGYVEFREITENGKLKKLYCVTESGKRNFDEWVNGAIDGSAPKNPQLAKIYFMGMSQKENREALLEQYVTELKTSCAVLEKICEEGEKLARSTNNNDILYFQLQSAKYGRDFMRFNVDWYARLLAEIKRIKHENAAT